MYIAKYTHDGDILGEVKKPADISKKSHEIMQELGYTKISWYNAKTDQKVAVIGGVDKWLQYWVL